MEGGTPLRGTLEKHQFTVRRKYGQNFLTDPGILRGIAEAAELGKDDVVLEIGPGTGSLTRFLAERAGKVTAVEIDRKLGPILEESLAPYPNTEVIFGDILKMDPVPEDVTKVVSNLPYYITTPVLMKFLEGKTLYDKMVFLMQAEVADRILSEPGKASYGALTVTASYRAAVRRVMNVPRECFWPRPQVDSTVLCFSMYREKPVRAADEELLFRLVRAAFCQRRKTLANALSGDRTLGVSREEVQDALDQLGLPADVRGERLSAAQFCALSDVLGTTAAMRG